MFAIKYHCLDFWRIQKFLLVSTFLLLMGCSNPKAPEFTLRASLLAGEHHTWFKAFEYFGELVEERSQGRIVVNSYHSEQLAKEIEAIRMIRSEVIDMTTTSSLLSNWIDIMAFCEMPFLFEDIAAAEKMIYGPIGQRIETEMLEKTGLRPLGFFMAGGRHLTSNRPIRHPDDLKGLILRVPNVPSFVTAWDALGAKTTPMAFSEVFTGLQQGTIEAQENPLALIKNTGFYEVQEYINLTGHVISWTYPVIGEKQFQKLPHDLQEILVQAARDMQIYERKIYLEKDKEIREELLREGITFVEVDKTAFIETCGDAIYKTLAPEMQEVYDFIRNTPP